MGCFSRKVRNGIDPVHTVSFRKITYALQTRVLTRVSGGSWLNSNPFVASLIRNHQI